MNEKKERKKETNKQTNKQINTPFFKINEIENLSLLRGGWTYVKNGRKSTKRSKE